MRGRRSRCKAKEVIQPSGTAEQEVLRDSIEEDDEAEVVKGFFACYLLCSLSPRHKGHTYIGFTVNPQRRIKQHNGEKRCGAWRTKRGRPWEMVLCIYGFPSNVSALQFEWAWQHPTESLAVRKVASSFKSLSGMANKIKLAYAMLNLSCWESLNLTVNFFSTKYMKHIAGCPRLPNQMRVNICSMDDLPCYSEEQPLHCSNDDEEEEDGEVDVDRLGINIFSSVDVAVEEINRNIDHMESSSQFSEPVYYNSEFSKPSEEQYDRISHSSRMLLELNECTRDSASSSCSKDSVMERVEMSVNWSSPRSYNNETMAVSPNIDMINLCTPSTGIIRSKTKRALFESDIIDLTDSPTVIHL